jgi:hypothetical protein
LIWSERYDRLTANSKHLGASAFEKKIIPLEAPCQDIPDFPEPKLKVAYILVIGVA